MAQPIYFKQAQAAPLKANGNPDTNDMPMGIATRPESTGAMPYIISKWKFSAEEKKVFVDKIQARMVEYFKKTEIEDRTTLSECLRIIEDEYDHVWLALMHTAVPALILSQDPYETAGYVNIHPNEN